MHFMRRLMETVNPLDSEEIYPNPRDDVDIRALVDGDIGFIHHLEVDDDVQRRGIGTAVEREFEIWAKQHGARYIETHALKDSIGFWLKIGFRFIKVLDEYEVLMRKTLQ